MTRTIFRKALEELGHVFTECVDGSVDLEANPERAGAFGEVTEADYRIAEDAVRRAYDAGERDVRVLGVVFHPDCDAILGSGPVPPVPGSYGVFDR
jgi:hypothetical protein